MLARSLQLPILVFDLKKQAGVLDGEGGLRREGPEQFDGLGQEVSRAVTGHAETADAGLRGVAPQAGSSPAMSREAAKLGQRRSLAQARPDSSGALASRSRSQGP